MCKRKFVLSMLINGVLISGLCMASAADITAGAGKGVAVGGGSNAPKEENVAVGKGAAITYSNGKSLATGDIALGSGVSINNYASQGGSVAIGYKAEIENMSGRQEASFTFGQTETSSGNWSGTLQIPKNPERLAGSVAIGHHTFARSGSIMIGAHNFKGPMGDIEVDTDNIKTYNLNVNATTLGTNSFNQGAHSTVIGAYSIISGKYNGGFWTSFYAGQNMGAVITGSLNSIESATSSSYYSGIGNTVTGSGNRTHNSNGSLIYGVGNEITNSVTDIKDLKNTANESVPALAIKLREVVRTAKGGGSTIAFGTGNRADYTLRSTLIGGNNTLIGEEKSVTTNTIVEGFDNNVSKVNDTVIAGSDNLVSEVKNSVILGDNHTIENAEHAIIIGTSDDKSEKIAVNDVVSIGHNAGVSVADGVAVGSDSKATVAAGAVGYDAGTQAPSTNTDATWKSTKAAFSVGNVDKGITRQITSVAAGTNDTDAVNVAQLKKLESQVNANGSAKVNGGDHIKVTMTETGSVRDYKVSLSDDVTKQISGNTSGIREVEKTIHKVEKDVTPVDHHVDEVETHVNTVERHVDAVEHHVDGVESHVNTMEEHMNSVQQGMNSMRQTMSGLDHRLNKSVAGAAALAALHPMDINGDAKWDIAAGYGHYRDGNAAALGAFYRPNEDVQFSVGSTLGNGESIINAGVSLKVGSHDKTPHSWSAVDKEIADLKDTVAAQNKRIDQLTDLLNEAMRVNTKTEQQEQQ